jgi:putative ABC transport system permease protein
MSAPRLMVMLRVGRRMMLHDVAKLVGTTLGVVFAVVLGVQQLSILLGLLQKNTMFVEHAGADVWVVPTGTEVFQPGPLLDSSVVSRARATAGVAVAEPLVVSGAALQKATGGVEPVTLVGTVNPTRLGGPWNVVAGDADSIERPDTVVFEDSERETYGAFDLGTERELGGRKVRCGGFTWGLIPFGPAYAFGDVDLVRDIARVPVDRASFVLVRAAPGQDVEALRDRLAARIPEHLVLTRDAYERSIVVSLLRDQLGASFATSTSFGLIVGFVIVALSMFSSVIDNLREFGTLKAIGARNIDLALLIVGQAITYALLGSLIGIALVGLLAEAIRSPQLVPIVPLPLVAAVPLVMVLVCTAASILAMVRIRSLEPGMVFR